MEHSLTGTALERQNNDNELSHGENGREEELSPKTECIEFFPVDSTSDQELSPVEEAIKILTGDSSTDPELSPVEEAIELSLRDSKSDQELSPVEDDSELFPVDSTSDQELSPVEEAMVVVSGDSPTDEELSPVEEAIEVDPEDSTSDRELFELEEAIKHSQGKTATTRSCPQWKVPMNSPEGTARVTRSCPWVKRSVKKSCPQGCKEKVETHLREPLDSMSSLDFNVGDHVHSKGVPVVSQGHEAIQNNVWNKPLGLVDDEDPLEEPSCSRHVDTEVAVKSACADELSASPALWGPTGARLAAVEEEEPPKPLALEVTEPQGQHSEKCPSCFRQALQGPFRCPSLLQEPFRCPSLVLGLFWCPCMAAQPEE
ncbi:unnamed protein product [Coccothraustes coccothraustes]